MTIFINGTQADITLDTEKTVGDVLDGLSKEFEANNAAIIMFSVNDAIAETQEQLKNFRQESVDSVDKLEITIILEAEVQDAFKELGEQFYQIAQSLKQISLMFQNNQEKAAAFVVKNLADTVDSFCKVVAISTQFPQKFANLKIDNKTLPEFFTDLSPILAEFEQSLENADTVLTGDLAEYEISPRLEQITEMTRGLN